MKCFKLFLVAIIAVVCLTAAAPQSQARVGIAVAVGPEPVCPYGYYYDPPYACAPYGYYGPEWFSSGVFIGAGRGGTATSISGVTSTAISTDTIFMVTIRNMESTPIGTGTISTTFTGM